MNRLEKLLVTLFCLVGVAAIGVFAFKDRYQISFGSIQVYYHHTDTYKEIGRVLSGLGSPTSTESYEVPICVKIDTLTGQTWFYRRTYVIPDDGGFSDGEDGFVEMPSKYDNRRGFITYEEAIGSNR